MALLKTIQEGQPIPLFHGVVGPSFVHNRGFEVSPIPLNYLLRFWYFLLRRDNKFLNTSGFQKLMATEYQKGYEDGVGIGQIQLKERLRAELDAELKEMSKQQLTKLIEADEAH